MKKGNPGIWALGHVLLDIFGELPDNPGEPLMGSPVMHLEHGMIEEAIADTVNGSSNFEGFRNRVGGGQALVALAARALGLNACLSGSVGADEEGDRLRSWLKEYGVLPDISTGVGRTGIFLCLSGKDGEKRIFVDPGAAKGIRGREFRRELFKPGWILSIDGLLIDSPVWLAQTAERARNAGMRVALDLSTPSNARVRGCELKEFAELHCDFVFANEKEFEAVQATAGRIIAPRETWVVKLGPKGSLSFRGGNTWSSEAKWIDSRFDTGAGDFFAAGYLAGQLDGLSEETCLFLGNEAAARLVRRGDGGFPLDDLALLGRSALTDGLRCVDMLR